MTKNAFRCAVVIFAALLWNTACKPPGAVGPAEYAAPLSGPALNGKNASLADYKGKVVFVDFWATWCGPCKAEIPELVKLQTALGPKGFVVLGVSMDEEVSKVAPFAKKAGITYPVILNGGERAPKGWVVPGLPTGYLISRDGKILKRLFGSKPIDKLAVDVEAALAP